MKLDPWFLTICVGLTLGFSVDRWDENVEFCVTTASTSPTGAIILHSGPFIGTEDSLWNELLITFGHRNRDRDAVWTIFLVWIGYNKHPSSMGPHSTGKSQEIIYYSSSHHWHWASFCSYLVEWSEIYTIKSWGFWFQLYFLGFKMAGSESKVPRSKKNSIFFSWSFIPIELL